MTDDLVEANRRLLNHLRDRVEELETENERLRDRLATLENVVDPDPTQTDYEQLTKGQKVYRVRKALVEEAAQSDGRAAVHYDDVRWLFDRNPSPGHCYDLMKQAGQLDGFDYDESHDQIRLTVNLDAVNDETLIHAANNATGGAPA